ncbi:hypothetical protein PSHT_12455 [Puccinia striiformis]|uniref:Uncharacterized protein n=1 Tax=Puccinia striiformis TaxID=27350 RepID=A0A2S4UWG6_9BASI|nr:hypothetical protein PSHT_12455 [Puccinia striiformis]
MPKLQYFTAHLLDEDKNVFRNGCPKHYTRLTPIPFDMVVKVFLDGCFLAGRCFLAGDSDPVIFDYEIGPDQNNYNHCRGSSDFQFNGHFLEFKSQSTNAVSETKPLLNRLTVFIIRSLRGLPIIADWTDIPPVILHEEPEPCLSIVWECTRSELQRN